MDRNIALLVNLVLLVALDTDEKVCALFSNVG